MAVPPLLLDLSFLPPGQMMAPRIVGGSIEGGSSLSGLSQASDVTGGGFVAVSYSNIQLGNANRDRILFFNRLATALQGGVRTCVVPLMTDYIAPYLDSQFPFGVPPGMVQTGFSDGTVFSDGSSFSQPPVSGLIGAGADAGSGTVHLTVSGGRPLQGGEWFGVNHQTKSFRAYCVTDIDYFVDNGNQNYGYIVGIRPTLRDSITSQMQVDWFRPRCLMRIKPGSDPALVLQGFWYGTPSLDFIEAL